MANKPIEQSWLLIFDNVEQWDLLDHYLPVDLSKTHGSVLVTTQDEEIAKLGSSSVFLQPFNNDEAVAMLLDRIDGNISSDDSNQKSAQKISALVGGLPVALANVAGYINYTQCSLSELHEMFRESQNQHISVTSDGDTMPEALQQGSLTYQETMAIMEYLTLRELPTDCQDLLYILAFVNCEFVQENILRAVHQVPFLNFLDSRQTIRSTL